MSAPRSAPPTLDSLPDPLDLREVAALLRISIPTVRNMIVDGKLKAINLSAGSKKALYRIRKSDYIAWFEKS